MFLNYLSFFLLLIIYIKTRPHRYDIYILCELDFSDKYDLSNHMKYVELRI